MGNARTGLFNFLFARHHGGTFLLRVEDTDRARSTPEAVDVIFDSLAWLGVEIDGAPVFQSERLSAHLEAIRRLEADGKAYRCYCDKETLETMRNAQREAGEKPRYDRRCLGRSAPSPDAPYVLRFKTPREGTTTIDDAIKGPVTVSNDELDDLIILRTDGSPTYNMVVVVDDLFMKITHVIRGDDHLNNTFRQVQIYRALGAEPPTFAHLPLIKGLSKRKGSASVGDYRDRGFLSEAIINYIARLGWAHGDDEILSIDELFEKFDLDGVSKSPAAFDEDKLTWLNQHYMKTLAPEVVATRLLPFLEEVADNATADDRLTALVLALRERSKTLVDMAEGARFAYVAPEEYNPKAVKKWIKGPAFELLEAAVEQLAEVDPFTAERIDPVIRSISESFEVGLGKIAQPIRICLTGSAVSPPLFDTLAIVGQAESLARMRRGIAALRAIRARD
jgi:glutamyl-tRNA synthetase